MRKGFTLIELLIVITIIILLVGFILINIRGQINRANDTRRKSDLSIIHNGIEEYRTDRDAFPQADFLSECDGVGFSPYIKKMPCDPERRVPYGYFPSIVTGGYRICAILSDKTDPAITAMGCNGPDGCGLSGGYNYCLAQGTTASAIGTADQLVGVGSTPTPTPTIPGGTQGSTPVPAAWACAPLDINGNSFCNFYSDPAGSGCPVTYDERTCKAECQDNPAVRCNQ